MTDQKLMIADFERWASDWRPPLIDHPNRRLARRREEWRRATARQSQLRYATITPTSPTFSTPIGATSYATSTSPGTTVTLDLKTAFGARLYCRIGRNAATALTRSAYLAIRRQCNNTIIHPDTAHDFISTIAAVNATTVSSGGASGATTMVLASGTGFAAYQTVCAQLSGARCEFFQICNLTTATITVDRSGGFRVTHNASDVVTNGADVGTRWLPGGDIWEITPVNNSGQTVVMWVEAAVYASDTST